MASTRVDAPVRLGFLYPGYAAEDDYPFLAERVDADRPVEARVVHTSVGEDAHRVDALLDLGSDERLRDGARELQDHGVDVAIWACTSGSFVFGLEGARAQAQRIADGISVPASSTSLAYVHALEAMAVQRVAIAATYPEDVTARFHGLLTDAGFDVVSASSNDIITAAEVGTFPEDRVLSVARSADHSRAEAVLVPDTAMHTARWVEQMEEAAGKPVLTANLVTFWHALQLAGVAAPTDGLGTLFRLP